MNDEELRLSFEELRRALENSNLTWVIQQVNQQIEEGKLVDKQAAVFKDKELSESNRFSFASSDVQAEPTKSKADFVGVEEYTAYEELMLLLDAIEAVVDAAAMRTEIAKSILGTTESDYSATSVHIGDTTISRQELFRDDQIIDRLMFLVEEFRRLANNGNS